MSVWVYSYNYNHNIHPQQQLLLKYLRVGYVTSWSTLAVRQLATYICTARLGVYVSFHCQTHPKACRLDILQAPQGDIIRIATKVPNVTNKAGLPSTRISTTEMLCCAIGLEGWCLLKALLVLTFSIIWVWWDAETM